MTRSLHLSTPLGPMTLTASDAAIVSLHFGEAVPAGSVLAGSELAGSELAPDGEVPPLLRHAARELAEYFAGRRHRFTLPLAPQGTPFQQRVWEALRSIPCGETRTYGQIARQIGRPGASRAVGMANNRNPIAILIPCHRVIGADGRLTGYAAGIEVKARLLELERRPVHP